MCGPFRSIVITRLPSLGKTVRYRTRLTQCGLFEGPARHLMRIVHVPRCYQNVENVRHSDARSHGITRPDAK
jgi:hypothetical protein